MTHVENDWVVLSAQFDDPYHPEGNLRCCVCVSKSTYNSASVSTIVLALAYLDCVTMYVVCLAVERSHRIADIAKCSSNTDPGKFIIMQLNSQNMHAH